VKFVADENVDRQIVDGLRKSGHSVLSIAEMDPGVDDETVLGASRQEGAVLITADKDFGELVFRQGLLHRGTLLLRLAGLNMLPPGWGGSCIGIFAFLSI
jgi:predicted nuclease of predicted toxin-antitoxin system